MIAILYREPLVQVSAAAANISLQDAKQIQRSSAEEIQNIAEQVAVSGGRSLSPPCDVV